MVQVYVRTPDVSNLLELALKNLNYSKKRIFHYTFLVEEALYHWHSRLPEDSLITVSRSENKSIVYFKFSLKGEKVDPFEYDKIEDFTMIQMLEKLKSGIGSELRYIYKYNTNMLILRLPKKNEEVNLFCYNIALLTIPFTLQAMFSNIASNIDTMMLGFIDSNSMSGVSLASVFVTLPKVLIESVVFGSTVLIAQYWGKRDKKGVEQVEGISLLTAIFIAMIFFLLGLLMPEKIMSLYSNSEALILSGSIYLRYISPSFLISAVYLLLFCFMQCTGGVKKALYYSIIGCISNVIFNLIFIFGFLGIPALGVKGAALATVLSSLVQAGLTIKELSNKKFIKPKFTFHLDIDYKVFFITIATIGAQRFSWNLANNFVNAAIGHMDANIVAANSVLLIISGFVLSLKSGFGKGVGLQMGAYLGKNEFNLAKERCNDALKYGTKVALCIVPVFILIGIYFRFLPMNLSAEALEAEKFMIIIYSINIFFSCMNGMLNTGFLYAGGDSKSILIIDTIVMWGLMVPVSLISINTSIIPITIALVILEWNEVFSFPLKYHRVRQYKWLKNLTK